MIDYKKKIEDMLRSEGLEKASKWNDEWSYQSPNNVSGTKMVIVELSNFSGEKKRFRKGHAIDELDVVHGFAYHAFSGRIIRTTFIDKDGETKSMVTYRYRRPEHFEWARGRIRKAIQDYEEALILLNADLKKDELKAKKEAIKKAAYMWDAG